MGLLEWRESHPTRHREAASMEQAIATAAAEFGVPSARTLVRQVVEA
jgi:hypothetical protein